jgi:peptidoglycan/LPS O-acetylase OafA/YrhL
VPASQTAIRQSVAPAAHDYIPTLDGWRAVAIILVLAHHFITSFCAPEGPRPNPSLYAFGDTLAIGVDIFFVLSGYLICTRLLEERANTGRISLKAFYIRRAFRILPPYLFYMAVLGTLATLGLVTFVRQEVITCLLFVRNYLPRVYWHWYTGHFWSLSVEEHFYLIWPPLLVFAGVKRNGVRQAGLLAFGGALLIAAWRTLDHRYQLFVHLEPNTMDNFRSDVRIDELFWGCGLAVLLQAASLRRNIARVLSVPVWSVAIILLLSCVWMQPHFELVWQSILLAALLTGTSLNPDSIPGRLLEISAIRWIGRISYSLYIWQQLFVAPYPHKLGWLQDPPWNFAAAFLCAAASYYLLERPMMRRGKVLAARSGNI